MIRKFLLCVEENDFSGAVIGEKDILALFNRKIAKIVEASYIKRFSLRPIEEEVVDGLFRSEKGGDGHNGKESGKEAS